MVRQAIINKFSVKTQLLVKNIYPKITKLRKFDMDNDILKFQDLIIEMLY